MGRWAECGGAQERAVRGRSPGTAEAEVRRDRWGMVLWPNGPEETPARRRCTDADTLNGRTGGSIKVPDIRIIIITLKGRDRALGALKTKPNLSHTQWRGNLCLFFLFPPTKLLIVDWRKNNDSNSANDTSFHHVSCIFEGAEQLENSIALLF